MSPQILERAFHRVDFDRELVYKFFTVFSLFEHALKQAGFLKQGEAAEPDWDAFITSIESDFCSDCSTELQTAVTYLLKDPPKKQFNRNGQVVFARCDPENGISEIKKLSIYIRRVRNNLFHGGKFRYERPRDTFLIQFSLIILEEWAKLNPDVQRVLMKVN